MTTEHTITNPVLRNLATLLEGIDVDPNPERSDFKFCPARARATQERCRHSIASKEMLPAKEQRIKDLLASFKNLTECPNDDKFYDDIEEFLAATHCWQHYDGLLRAKFRDWKKQGSIGLVIVEKENETVEVEGVNRPDCEIIISPPVTAVGGNVHPQPTVEEMEHSKPVDTLADDLSIISINMNNDSDTTESDYNNVDGRSQDIIGLGLASLKRSGSLRDDSPVMKELYRHLTPEENAEGVVYVLEHREIDGLFKIGSSNKDASSGLHQDNDCYGTSAKVIYQTSGGPFHGAFKAGKLAQVLLQHHNISISQCEKCGNAHTGWFKASKEHVCDTVKTMEKFVQLPGYTMQGGLIRISPLGDKVIKSMQNFSSNKMEMRMAKERRSVKFEANSKEIMDVTTTVTKMTVVTESSYKVSGEVFPRSRTSLDRSMDQIKMGPGHRRRKSWAGNMAKNLWGKITRSRRSHPENEEKGVLRIKNEAAAPITSSQFDAEDMTVGLLWSMIPEDVKAGRNSMREDRPRNYLALKDTVEKASRDGRDGVDTTSYGKVKAQSIHSSMGRDTVTAMRA